MTFADDILLTTDQAVFVAQVLLGILDSVSRDFEQLAMVVNVLLKFPETHQALLKDFGERGFREVETSACSGR